MACHGLADPEGALTHRWAPVDVGRRQLDLREHHVHHAVEEVVLAGHVPVEGHRGDAHRPGERAHGECLEPDLVGVRDRGIEDTEHATAVCETTRSGSRLGLHRGHPSSLPLPDVRA